MLDEIDEKILTFIQNNARTSNAQIARAIGRTTSGVFDRIKKLEQRGIIKGYQTLIDRRAFGLDLTAFILVKIHPSRETRKTGRLLAEVPCIQEVYQLAGDWTFLCKVLCKEVGDIEHVLGRINDVESVTGTHVSISLRTYKEGPALPVQPGSVEFEPLSIVTEEKMREQAPVFEKIYQDYLQQLALVDFNAVSPALGTQVEQGCAGVVLLGREYSVGPRGIFGPDGEQPHHAVSVVLAKYLLSQPGEEAAAEGWASYKDFRDAAPFVGGFVNNTEKPIARAFSGKMEKLEEAATRLGGEALDMDLPYQLALRFDALPKVPLLLLFNDADDEFPAKATVLFKKDASRYLDMECLAILGMLLAHELKGLLKRS